MSRIGINALYLIPNKVGGTEYLLRSFLKELEKQDHTNQYVVFCNQNNFDTFKFESKRFEKVLIPIDFTNKGARIIFEQVILPFLVLWKRCQILHSFGYFGPALTLFYKHVVTIHDTNWLDHPEDMTWLTRHLLNILISLNIFSSSLVITDSDFARKRILKYYPNASEKTNVVWPGVDNDFLQKLKKKSIPLIKQDYFLIVSAFYPHKKIAEFISLWSKMPSKDKLVIIGDRGLDKTRVEHLISSDKSIIHFTKVSFSNLVNYYKHAKGFIAPSVYEGFGFPVYEAAAAGLPIWVGKRSLYEKGLQKHLFQIKNFLKRTKNLPHKSYILDYALSTKKLISLYEKLNS